MPDRFSEVANNIYRGGIPSSNDIDVLKDIYNINTIISLDGNIGGSISNKVKSLGIEHIIIPIGGEGSLPLIKYLKSNIASLLDSKKPVYVHCRHGSDRTGMAIMFYRMQNEGWAFDQAFKEAKSFNFGDKLDDATERLYLSEIKNDDDNLSYDSALHSTINQFDSLHPPAYSPQQSFSIPEDIKYTTVEDGSDSLNQFKDPYAFISSNTVDSEQESRKRKIRQVALETSIPQVGGIDGGNILMGAGPIDGDGFLNILDTQLF